MKILREALPEMIGGLMLLLLVFFYNSISTLQLNTLIGLLIGLVIIVLTCIIVLKTKSIANIQVAKSIGFINRTQDVTVEMHLDGSFDYTLKYNLEVKRDKLYSRAEAIIITGESTFQDMNVKVESKNRLHNVSHEIVSHSQQYAKIIVKFSPALKRGEAIDYTITYSSKSGFLLTYEDVVNQINNKVWPFSSPFEFTALSVKYPTMKLSFQLRLPIGYKIYGEEFWDIGLLDDYERVEKIYQRLKKNADFKSFHDSEGHQVLQIVDESPTISTLYILKFIPPSSDEYQRLLGS